MHSTKTPFEGKMTVVVRPLGFMHLVKSTTPKDFFHNFLEASFRSQQTDLEAQNELNLFQQKIAAPYKLTKSATLILGLFFKLPFIGPRPKCSSWSHLAKPWRRRGAGRGELGMSTVAVFKKKKNTHRHQEISIWSFDLFPRSSSEGLSGDLRSCIWSEAQE